jgi:hypothetical protein
MFTDDDKLQNITTIIRLHYYMLLYFFDELIIYVYNDFTLNLLAITSVSPCCNILQLLTYQQYSIHNP